MLFGKAGGCFSGKRVGGRERRRYSVHLETQFFLALVSPVEGTETGLTGGRKKTKYKMGSKVNAMQKNRKGFAPFPENS